MQQTYRGLDFNEYVEETVCREVCARGLLADLPRRQQGRRFTYLYEAESCTRLPLTSAMSVLRLRGPSGQNCQCRVTVPGAMAHSPICATRNVPAQPVPQLFSAPAA